MGTTCCEKHSAHANTEEDQLLDGRDPDLARLDFFKAIARGVHFDNSGPEADGRLTRPNRRAGTSHRGFQSKLKLGRPPVAGRRGLAGTARSLKASLWNPRADSIRELEDSDPDQLQPGDVARGYK